MSLKRIPFVPTALAALAGLCCTTAQAQVYGSLANFDVVNHTGHSAYGFEIEIEDSRVHKSSQAAQAAGSFNYVDSVFGYDRSFGGIAGGNPLGVVRYGSVSIDDYSIGGVHAGVRITYGFAPGQALPAGLDPSRITQPAGPGGFNTPGESCWPGANANWTANPCDHFGVTTTGTPAITRYSWVLDTGSGQLEKQAVGIPAVYFNPRPAQPAANGLPAQPAVLRAEIEAVDDPRRERSQWGDAYWVKTYITKVKDRGGDDRQGNIDLGDLLLADGMIDGRLDVDLKTDMRLFQKAPDPQPGDDEAPEPLEVAENELALGDDDASVILRYEFFQYTGDYDARDHKADCNGRCVGDAEDFGTGVGLFVGRQIAGFNAVQPMAPVPEPQTWAMLLAGLLAIGALQRRSHPH